MSKVTNHWQDVSYLGFKISPFIFTLLTENTFNFQKPNGAPNVIICRQLNRVEMRTDLKKSLKKKSLILKCSASEELSLVLTSHISRQIDNTYVLKRNNFKLYELFE